ncbi:MAG: glycosyltransferase [Acidobacteriia bacterium]|nr:glycosyltransferase [Terriglobia bacterium]
MTGQRVISLLGRRDAPTDAVEEYCACLGAALQPHGFACEMLRVPWAERGWSAARAELRRQAAGWRGAWVLLQYTALAWSHRGFPLRVPRLLRLLKKSGARCAVVFHDVHPYSGSRVIDVVRQSVQRRVMRETFRLADLAFFTVLPETLAWVPDQPHKALFIPVGANFPAPERFWSSAEKDPAAPLSVAVFGVTGGAHIAREARVIAQAVRFAAPQTGRLRLVVLGRHSQEARGAFERELDASRIELQTLGVLPAEDVARTLAQADVLLFARGQISTRRSSALAGIACGLPVVAYSGPDTTAPITEAGVVLVKESDSEGLAAALERVLGDARLRGVLRQRSRCAQQNYFSWSAIAARYAAALRNPG